MDVGYSQKCADRLQPKRNTLCMDVGYSQKCAGRLQPKRNSLCMDVGYSQKCPNRPHPTRNTHSKDGDKQYKQSRTLDNLKPFRGGWVCVLARMCRLRKSRDINYKKAGWISFSLALDQGPGCPCTPWLLLCSGMWRCQDGEAVYAHALLGGRDK